MENPSWNDAAHVAGTAHVNISDMKVSTSEPVNPSNVVQLPNNFVDYGMYTPGGGGGPSYCPFPPGNTPYIPTVATSWQSLAAQLTAWGDSSSKIYNDINNIYKKLNGSDYSKVTGPQKLIIFKYAISLMESGKLDVTDYNNATSDEKTDIQTISGVVGKKGMGPEELPPSLIGGTVIPFLTGLSGIDLTDADTTALTKLQTIANGSTTYAAFAHTMQSTTFNGSGTINALIESLGGGVTSDTKYVPSTKPATFADVETDLAAWGTALGGGNSELYTNLDALVTQIKGETGLSSTEQMTQLQYGATLIKNGTIFATGTHNPYSNDATYQATFDIITNTVYNWQPSNTAMTPQAVENLCNMLLSMPAL